MPAKTTFTRRTSTSQDARLREWLKPKDDEHVRRKLHAMAYLIDPVIGSTAWGESEQDALVEYGIAKYSVTPDSF